MNAALFADSVDISFSHIGTAQNLTATGLEVPALRQASRWKSSRMPARYTEGQAAARWPGITRAGITRERGHCGRCPISTERGQPA